MAGQPYYAYPPPGYAYPASPPPPQKESLREQLKQGRRPAWLEGLTWGVALG